MQVEEEAPAPRFGEKELRMVSRRKFSVLFDEHNERVGVDPVFPHKDYFQKV